MQLVLCPQCALVFNSLFDPTLLEYDSSYDNSLDFSDRFRDYLNELVDRLILTYGLRKKRILEIGCGKGTFLRLLCRKGANEGIGFDPTFGSEGGAVGEGSVTFVRDMYRGDLDGKPPDVVCFRHVLEHLDNPARFLRDLRCSFPAGSAAAVYCEVPNAEAVFGGPSIWDIIYQHVSYFTAPALRHLFESNGFRILNIGTSYGGQFLFVEAAPSEGPLSARQVESDHTARLVAAFRQRFTDHVASWHAFLEEAGLEGRRLAFWGCGAKGVTFLNLVPSAARIGIATDVNPHKQGMYVPGTGQRISAPEELRVLRPDTIVIPNAIYKDEVERTAAGLGLQADVVATARSRRSVSA